MNFLKIILGKKPPKIFSYTELLAIKDKEKAQAAFLSRADGGERVEVFLEMYEHERKYRSFVLDKNPDDLDEGKRLIYSVFADKDVNASLKLLAQVKETTGMNLLVDIVYAKFATDYIMNKGSPVLKDVKSSPIKSYKDDNFDFSNENVHRDYQVYPQHNQFRCFFHFIDNIADSTTTIYEYNIIGYNINCRLLAKYSNVFGKDEYDVKDNFILETEIRERSSKNHFMKDDIEERLASLKTDTEWHPLVFNQLRYFILSRHIDLQTDTEFRKHLRTELEKIRLAVYQFNEYLQKHHLQSVSTEYGLQIHFPENSTADEKSKLNSLITDSLFVEYGISRDQYTASNDIQKYILLLLGEKGDI